MMDGRRARSALLACVCLSCATPAPEMLPWRPVAPDRVPGFRLATAQPGVRPLRQRVTLRLQDHASGRFGGLASIDIELRAPTDLVWMHGEGLEIEAVSVTGPGGRARGSAAIVGGDRLGVQLGRVLGPGTITVDIGYRGRLPADQTRGVARTPRDNVFTQLAGGAARRAFPCFDEPEYKVPWRLVVEVGADEEAVSNMPEVSRAAGEETRTITFAETPPLPASRIAVAAGGLAMNDIDARMPMRIVFEPGVLSAHLARSWTPERLDHLARLFGPRYAFPKLDVFPVSDLDPITAYPGLVVAPDSLDGDADVWALTRALAHAWVGDLVTPAWWDDAWLADGLATWMADRIDHSYGDFRRTLAARNRIMLDDSLAAARPVRAPVGNAGDRERSLAAFNGEKGAAVLRMVARWLGEDEFDRGLRRYLSAAPGVAGVDQLAAALDPDGARGVAGVLHDFLDRAGVPEIEAALDCSGGAVRVRLKQSVYRPIGAALEPRMWRIPVCASYPYRGQESFACTLLEGAEGEISLPGPICPEWALPLSGGDGYFHLRPGADLLARVFQASWLPPPSERAALVGEAVAALRAGALDVGAVMGLVETALADRSPFVRIAAGRFLVELDELGAVAAGDRAAFGRLVDSLLASRLRELGHLDRSSDGELARTERDTLLLAAGGLGADPALRTAAADSLDRLVYLQAAGSSVLPRIAARSARPATIKTLVQAWLRERATPIALAGFIPAGDASLALVLDARLIHTEAGALLDSALVHPATRPAAIRVLARRFREVAGGFPRERWPSLLEMMGRACEEDLVPVVDAALAREASRIAGGAQISREVRERVRQCLAYKQRVSADLHAFLEARR
jgi:alanyl aminopeptidase